MSDIKISIGEVREIENPLSPYYEGNSKKNENNKCFDGLRIRAKLPNEKVKNNWAIPWAFPLLPKSLQSIPKVGEAVLIFHDGKTEGQRYYIGPIISQPQFNTYAAKTNATSLLVTHDTSPLERISDDPDTTGAFPKPNDLALIGRGAEDIILRSNNGSSELTDIVTESEIQLRSGIRTDATNSDNPNMVGNIIFNGTDPAYIQLKYKKGIATKPQHEANSVINMVANRINIMSNKDDDVSDKLKDNQNMILDKDTDDIMDKLHQVPKGDKLVELLKIMKGCIMHHVHPWAGMEQCGDWGGNILKLDGYDIDSILSEYVRIS